MGLPISRWPWQAAKAKTMLEHRLDASRALPDVPDRTIVVEFEAMRLAAALDVEVRKAKGDGLDKIRIDIDVQDAAELAAFLRRSALRS